MTLIVKLQDPRKVERMLRRLAGQNKEVAADAVVSLVLKADRFAKEHALDRNRPPRPDTRRYANSIFHIINRRGGGNVDGAIASNDKKAPWLEEGTRPHVIKPRKKKALFWKGAAHPVRIVFHPGTPAYNVLGGAAEKSVKTLPEEIANSARRIIKR